MTADGARSTNSSPRPLETLTGVFGGSGAAFMKALKHEVNKSTHGSWEVPVSGGNKKFSLSPVLVPRSYILFQNISDTHFLLCERWKEHVILDAGPKQIQLWSRSIESQQQVFRVLNLNDWEDGNPLLPPFHPSNSWHCNLIGY